MRSLRAARLGAALAAPAALYNFARCSSESEQWLWTIDGTTLRRDNKGDVVFYDAKTGERLSARPPSVPPEAYANRWRWEPSDSKPAKNRSVLSLILVRHAQYDLKAEEDENKVLTPRGHRQSSYVAQRLAELHAAAEGNHMRTKLWTLEDSTLIRARQTADTIATALPDASRTTLGNIHEGRPCLPEPSGSKAWTNTHGNAERIEGAYRMLCARPPPGGDHATRLVVCHANVIRYIVCRALQLPPEAWLRMSLPHASITQLDIKSDGSVSLRCLGDSGHLPAELITT